MGTSENADAGAVFVVGRSKTKARILWLGLCSLDFGLSFAEEDVISSTSIAVKADLRQLPPHKAQLAAAGPPQMSMAERQYSDFIRSLASKYNYSQP